MPATTLVRRLCLLGSYYQGQYCLCSALRKEDGTYAPAHLLYDIRMERSGRNSVCEDVRSAPTGTTSASDASYQGQMPLKYADNPVQLLSEHALSILRSSTAVLPHSGSDVLFACRHCSHSGAPDHWR